MACRSEELYSPESIDRLGSRFARTESVSLLTLFTLDTNLTKSAFSQTRYTDSVLASLEPRLFHSKLLYVAMYSWMKGFKVGYRNI